MAAARREMVLSFALSSRLIANSSSDALSLTSPYLSSMFSMRRVTSGKCLTGDASFCSSG